MSLSAASRPAAMGGPPAARTGRPASWWRPPGGPAPGRLPIAVVLLAVLGGGTVAGARPGIDLPVLIAAVAVLTAWAARGRYGGPPVSAPASGSVTPAAASGSATPAPARGSAIAAPTPVQGGAPGGTGPGSAGLDRLGRVLLVLAVGLSAVAALRDSRWLVDGCLLVAVGLTAGAAVRARSWPAVLLSLTAVGMACLPGATWLAGTFRGLRRPHGWASWSRGALLAATLAGVFAGLLAWADPVFATVVRAPWPGVDLGALPGQVLTGVLIAGLVSGLVYAAASRLDWDRLDRHPRRRPAAEWLLPLAVVDAVLLAFVVVQGVVLLWGYPSSLTASGVPYAARAREGFGQLVAVTVLTVAVLGWAARRADPASARHRRLVAVAGGLLVALSLGVVASALGRMWRYEQAYGWTVLRLSVATFELWLAVVLALTAVAWLVRRTPALPRLVVVTAAVVLLGLGAAGPDALVAGWNVDRYEQSGKIDVEYLARLSDDAVPALACLRDRVVRRQTLAGREPQADPWYAVNLARWRAARILEADSGC